MPYRPAHPTLSPQEEAPLSCLAAPASQRQHPTHWVLTCVLPALGPSTFSVLSDIALFILKRAQKDRSESGKTPGPWLSSVTRLMSWKAPDRLLTSPSTHPAAPAVLSPRRRETSFSLPRRMDSRNSRSLEKELLLRRTWGGHSDVWGHGEGPPRAGPTRT